MKRRLHMFVLGGVFLHVSCFSAGHKKCEKLKESVKIIERRKVGENITNDFDLLMQNSSNYPFSNDGTPIPMEAIKNNPRQGFSWKTMYFKPDLALCLGFRAVTISIEKREGDIVFGGQVWMLE